MEVVGNEFPADNLGCPQPAEKPKPMPALVAGQRIMLRVGSGVYEYRTRRTQLIFCGER